MLGMGICNEMSGYILALKENFLLRVSFVVFHEVLIATDIWNNCYRICHRNVGKHYKSVTNTSHNHWLLLYKLAEQSTSGLGRLLEQNNY